MYHMYSTFVACILKPMVYATHGRPAIFAHLSGLTVMDFNTYYVAKMASNYLNEKCLIPFIGHRSCPYCWLWNYFDVFRYWFENEKIWGKCQRNCTPTTRIRINVQIKRSPETTPLTKVEYPSL